MKRRFLLRSLVIMAIMLGAVTSQAQTVAYRMVKTVSQYGEVREIGSNDSRGRYKTYVFFSNNKKTFYVAKYDGSRAGWPDEGSGYGSGFANQDVPANFTGVCTSVRDPMNFQYKSTQNGIKTYSCQRPLLARNLSNGSVYITGYATDVVKFNEDYSRMNVIQDYDKGLYGIWPFYILMDKGTTFVYERIGGNNSGDVFY